MIAGIYLAAGRSHRMGCNKLSLPLDGLPLGSLALKTVLLSNLDYIFVVARKQDPLNWVDPSLMIPPLVNKWKKVESIEADQGMSYSLKAGLGAANRLDAEAIVVVLADQPYVTQEMLNQLISQYRINPTGYVASSYNGSISPPVLFDSQLYSELMQLEGDQGAKRVIQHHPTKGRIIEFQFKELFLDVDTMEEYLSQIDAHL